MSQYVDEFKDFLREHNSTETFRKYILHSDCKIITSEQSYSLKNNVCNKFNVDFDNVIIVGSCKLGFSIKQTRRYEDFGDDSDIDVAIVSSSLFEKVWKAATDLKYSRADWPNKNNFFKYLSYGWIRPDKFPKNGNFEFGDEWWDFFKELTASGNHGPYKIAAGIYYTSYFLEKYQSICIEQCAAEITS